MTDTPIRANPVQGLSVQGACALIRAITPGVRSPSDAMRAWTASISGEICNHVQMVASFPAGPQALRRRLAMIIDAQGNGFLSSRKPECTGLGPSGLASGMAQNPIAPCVALQADGTADFDLMMQSVAFRLLACSTSDLAPNPSGAVMRCSMTDAHSAQETPEKTLLAVAAADCPPATRHPEGAIDFEGAVSGPAGTVVFLRISLRELEDEQHLSCLKAFSVEGFASG